MRLGSTEVEVKINSEVMIVTDFKNSIVEEYMGNPIYAHQRHKANAVLSINTMG